jgi:hypothetical protein
MRKKYTYIPKDEIESITTWNGKNITQDKILDGAYVRGNVKYAKGGMPMMAKLPNSPEGRMKDKLIQILNEMSERQLDMVADKYDVQGDLGFWVIALPNNKVEGVLRYCMSVMRGKYADGGDVQDFYENIQVHVQGVGTIYQGQSLREATEVFDEYYANHPHAEIVMVDEKYGEEIKWGNFSSDDDDEYADGGEIYTKSVEEQAQELLGNRFFELNPQEREDIINSFISDGVITPRVTYTKFEEEDFEYADGGGVATASYKVTYQMVGSKDKKEKLFTDKAKAEFFVETMEEDDDVKSVKLEEIKEKPAKATKEPTINLFGAAKKVPATTTGSKKARPSVEINGIGDDIERYNQLKAIMDNAKAESELIGGRIKEAGLEKYIEMYEQTGRNPPNFDIVSDGNSILFMIKDAYTKVTPELKEMLENYGDGLVEVTNTYSFDNEIIEKKVKGSKTIGDIISELIMKSQDIPAEDKANLISVKEVMRVPKGTIDRLADYDNIEEVFNLIQPQLALK